MRRAVFILLALVILAAGPSFAGVAMVKTATIDEAPGASGTWTAPFTFGGGYFNISVNGASWAGTVTLQRSFDGSNWLDVGMTWTANSEDTWFDPEETVYYRLGMKQGAYGSGSVDVRLSRSKSDPPWR